MAAQKKTLKKAVNRKTRQKPHDSETERYEVDVDPVDELAFRIDGELEYPVFSISAAARLIGYTPDKLERLIIKYDLKPKKRLVWKSGKKANAYYIADIMKIIERSIEQSFLEPSKPQRDMHPEKYGGFKRGGEGNSKIDHELRLTRARADKAELELAEAASELLVAADVVEDVGDMLVSFKSKVLSLPPKLASSVPVELRSEVETNARVLVNETLEELAEYRPRVHRKPSAAAEAATDTQG